MQTINWDFTDGFLPSDPESVQEFADEVVLELRILTRRLRKAVKDLGSNVFNRLKSQLRQLPKMLRQAFTVESLADLAEASRLYGSALAGQLYGLQQRLGQFRIALIQAAAPIAQLLLPVVQTAVEALTGFANAVGSVLSTLLFGTQSAQDYAGGLTQVAGAGKKLKRSLAGFDQLNRLADNTASGIASVTQAMPLTGKWAKLAQGLQELLEPLRQIDLTPLAQSLKKLVDALQPIKKELFAGLEWAWYNLFVPLAQWTAQELLPAFLDALAGTLQVLATVIQELKPMFTWLWESCLKPLAQWTGDQAIAYLRSFVEQLQGVSGWVGENASPIESMIGSIQNFILMLGQLIQQILGWDTATQNFQSSWMAALGSVLSSRSPLGTLLSQLAGLTDATGSLAGGFGLIGTASNTAWQGICQAWGDLWGFLKEEAADPAYEGIRATVNAIIGLINGVLQSMAKGVNFLTGSLNKLGISIPDWIPVIGGKRFQFNLGTVTAPQIPYLATGAVLPANRPFLAMVGDQRHGTNVEAPLTTIQEAVATVMADQLEGILAGFAAVTQRQEKLLQAVLGIDLSDGAIAGAVERYQQKMAIVMGG